MNMKSSVKKSLSDGFAATLEDSGTFYTTDRVAFRDGNFGKKILELRIFNKVLIFENRFFLSFVEKITTKSRIEIEK
jgi:hypothetical protein